MKLFLSSHSLSNKLLVNAFYKLVGKPANKTSIAFIPTAMNISSHDKKWFSVELGFIANTQPKFLDIVDISALPPNIIYSRLDKVDVLFFGGGNATHLLHWIYKTKLNEHLHDYLQSKVYAGISAGSIITTPSLFFSNEAKRRKYQEQFGVNYDNKTLNLVQFYIRPHYNTPSIPHTMKNVIRKKAKRIKEPVYAIDDKSAIIVNDNQIDVVSAGNWDKF